MDSNDFYDGIEEGLEHLAKKGSIKLKDIIDHCFICNKEVRNPKNYDSQRNLYCNSCHEGN